MSDFFGNEDAEAKSLGWISNLDSLLVGTVFTFTIATAAIFAYAKKDAELTERGPWISEVKAGELKTDIESLRKELQEKQTKLDDLSTLLASSESQAELLESSLTDLKSKYPEPERAKFAIAEGAATDEKEGSASLDKRLHFINRGLMSAIEGFVKMQKDNAMAADKSRTVIANLQALIGRSETQTDLIEISLANLKSIHPELETSKITTDNNDKSFGLDIRLDAVNTGLMSAVERFVRLQHDSEKSSSETRNALAKLEQNLSALRSVFKTYPDRVRSLLLNDPFDGSLGTTQRISNCALVTKSMEKTLSELLKLQSSAFESLKQEIVKYKRQEFAVRRELLGIGQSTDLSRVAIVLDRSGSMEERSGAGKRGWEIAKQTVKSWIENLGMKECVLVSFSTDIRPFPEKGMITLDSKGNTKDFESLLRELEGLKPDGSTNTLDALVAAYDRNPTAILLFTDGEPTQTGANAKPTAQLVSEIKELAKSKKTPLIVVGIGDYGYPVCESKNRPKDPNDLQKEFSSKRSDWSPSLLQFLQELADETGGTFIGRDYYPASKHTW